MTTPYTARILELLGDRDPLELLAATPSRLEDLFWQLGEKGLDRRIGEAGWTARQILAHIADAEIGYGFRFRQVLSEDAHRIQPFDQDAWTALYRGVDASLALELFRALRLWNLSVLRALTPEQLERAGQHPERGVETVALMIKLLAGHDLNHIAQLERIAGER